MTKRGMEHVLWIRLDKIELQIQMAAKLFDAEEKIDFTKIHFQFGKNSVES